MSFVEALLIGMTCCLVVICALLGAILGTLRR